ncbi:MAG: ABC transporter permease [Erysipelotrichia bacterium]|jgi:multidrug/hemolysin transport system permease protein|nr:ABC transporter permease [Erysipelotrichia bacterium]
MILKLVERNLKRYLKDTMGVFFSFLSVIMVIIMYAVFLGDNTLNSVKASVGDIPYVDGMVMAWLMAGIVFISTVTVPISVLGLFSEDRSAKTLNDFYTSPISRSSFILSYLFSSLIITTMMSTLNFVFGQLYILTLGYGFIPLNDILLVLLVIMLCSLTYSSLFFFLALIMKSSKAFGSLGGIVGTLIGFFGGIYVPIGVISTSIANLIHLLPFSYGVTLMRRVYMNWFMGHVFDGAPEGVRSGFESFFGLTVEIQDWSMPVMIMIIGLLLYTLVFYGLSVMMMNTRKMV